MMAGALDTAWVLRWLDDAGLPQHKDTFLAARVDGRLLHRLTLDELAGLHVTSVLHAASIRTGIQVCVYSIIQYFSQKSSNSLRFNFYLFLYSI